MSGLNDGWDDDSDLNNICQENDLDFSGDGWGDDDGLDFGDDEAVPSYPVQQILSTAEEFSTVVKNKDATSPQFGNPKPALQSLRQQAESLVATDNEGWGDDDLNFDDDPISPDAPSNQTDSNKQANVTEDGWGDDDSGFDEETIGTSGEAKKTVHQQIEAIAKNSASQDAEDGWGDDLDFDDDDDDDAVVENEKDASSRYVVPTQLRQTANPPLHYPHTPKKQTNLPPPKQIVTAQPPKQNSIPPPPKQRTPQSPKEETIVPTTTQVQEDGWSESNNSDSDLPDFDDGFGIAPIPTEDASNRHRHPTLPVQQDGRGCNSDVVEDSRELKKSLESGWGDDDDFFADDTSETPDFPPQVTLPNPRRQQLLRDLKAYVGSLNHMLSSVNAVLDYEYNTRQKAMELTEYYQTRKNLAEYTRTKELNRMSYRVILPNGDVVLDKREIATNFLPDQSLAARCANQSLLADLLQVITDKDLIVRPQFMAICIAHDCKFTIHTRDETVEAAAQLHISLPQADGQRADIANIYVTIAFIPHQPMVHFRVNAIHVTLQEHDFEKVLSSSVDFLMECQIDEFEHDRSHATPADVYRDAFMANSQKIFAQSAVGMKSALQEMESVINIKQKLNIVKRFIPDTDVLLAAEQEAMEFAANRQGFQQQPIPHPNDFQPRPPPPPPPRQTQPSGNRPQSILGGLVRSGLNKLSKALPEDDPVIYGQTAPVLPPFYRQDPPPASYDGNQAGLSKDSHCPPHDAPPGQRSLQSYAPYTAQESPAATFGRQKGGHNSEQVDLSKGFPRPMEQERPDPKHLASSERRRTSEVDLSKGFPRPPPGPPPHQPKTAQTTQADLSKGFLLPPPRPPAPREALGSEEVDLSKGFPRPTPQRLKNQNRTSESIGGMMEDGWEDGSLDNEESNTSREHCSGTEENRLLTPREYFAFDATNYVYDPETDIIPTIKRWENLRPHRPYVVW